jgi:hypothetical protein
VCHMPDSNLRNSVSREILFLVKPMVVLLNVCVQWVGVEYDCSCLLYFCY